MIFSFFIRSCNWRMPFVQVNNDALRVRQGHVRFGLVWFGSVAFTKTELQFGFGNANRTEVRFWVLEPNRGSVNERRTEPRFGLQKENRTAVWFHVQKPNKQKN